MKWAYSIEQKRKAALLLVIVLVMVGAKNVLDKSNMARMGNSFAAVYEDRLVVEGYIYHLSECLHAQQVDLQQATAGDPSAVLRMRQQDTAIDRLVAEYEQTKCTVAEAAVFKQFKQQIQIIRQTQIGYSAASGLSLRNKLSQQYAGASACLLKLSGIQLAEGYTLKEQSRKIVASSTLLTYLELALLIAIGGAVLALIQASRSLQVTSSGDHSFN